MKLLSYMTLAALLSITSCSHFKKDCCAKKDNVTCTKTDCKKACCDKDKKCTDGSCTKEEKKACCTDDHCKKS